MKYSSVASRLRHFCSFLSLAHILIKTRMIFKDTQKFFSGMYAAETVQINGENFC